METSQTRAAQRNIIRQIRRLAHWAKGDARYRGPTNTDDFSSMALEKLVKRPTYNRALRSDPGKLGGLLRRVVRHAVIDRIRYERALRRITPPPEPTPPRQTPPFHSDIGHRRRVLAVRAALEKAAVDDGPHRIGPASKRGQMLEAFELRWRGYSHREIALALCVSKSTAGNWIEEVKTYIRRDVKDQQPDPC